MYYRLPKLCQSYLDSRTKAEIIRFAQSALGTCSILKYLYITTLFNNTNINMCIVFLSILKIK